jgi:hypothetical protein
MIISFQQWREALGGVGEAGTAPVSTADSGFRTATNTAMARKEFKTMDPRMLAFGANLAHAFGEIEAEKSGYTKRIISTIANGLNRFTEIPQEEIGVLRRKLLAAAAHLPSQPQTPLQPQLKPV